VKVTAKGVCVNVNAPFPSIPLVKMFTERCEKPSNTFRALAFPSVGSTVVLTFHLFPSSSLYLLTSPHSFTSPALRSEGKGGGASGVAMCEISVIYRSSCIFHLLPKVVTEFHLEGTSSRNVKAK